MHFDLGILGAANHYVGMLATTLRRYDLAEAAFVKAQAVHERLRAPFHRARTHLERARMLIARDGGHLGDQAAVDLETARRLAAEHGCALVERRACDLLAGSGPPLTSP